MARKKTKSNLQRTAEHAEDITAAAEEEENFEPPPNPRDKMYSDVAERRRSQLSEEVGETIEPKGESDEEVEQTAESAEAAEQASQEQGEAGEEGEATGAAEEESAAGVESGEEQLPTADQGRVVIDGQEYDARDLLSGFQRSQQEIAQAQQIKAEAYDVYRQAQELTQQQPAESQVDFEQTQEEYLRHQRNWNESLQAGDFDEANEHLAKMNEVQFKMMRASAPQPVNLQQVEQVVTGALEREREKARVETMKSTLEEFEQANPELKTNIGLAGAQDAHERVLRQKHPGWSDRRYLDESLALAKIDMGVSDNGMQRREARKPQQTDVSLKPASSKSLMQTSEQGSLGGEVTDEELEERRKAAVDAMRKARGQSLPARR